MTNLNDGFAVIVVGGGHAGTEAALAAARLGARTLLLSHNIETLGQMSCNPAIGGIGKGHLVKEIDALGGIMAHAADHAGIHFRILNSSKGPAVRATRAQADRALYKQFIRYHLEQQPNLSLFQQTVEDIIIKNNKVTGVMTQMGEFIPAQTVILTAGTFLGGKIHIGPNQYEGGRAGDPPANRLAQHLADLGLNPARLKTGTPPRIDGKTVDFSAMTIQHGDIPTPVFSYLGTRDQHPQQVACFITHTNEQTHAIIRDNLNQSPIYSGAIAGVGPRYCPSIEDKIVRFANKTAHQIFVEPEGLFTSELYPNGISTSLPFAAQCALVQSIRGFEHAHITRPGYAIEYDFFNPQELKLSLETKSIAGLFFAGQINGTTGYEEAAAQGLIAGLNAARFSQDQAAWTPRRDEAYIGVLIDDLITRGTQEPYRMFTSRAEYRLLLREDNADLRLTAKAYELGLVDQTRWQIFCAKQEAIAKATVQLKNKIVKLRTNPATQLETIINQPLTQEYHVLELLRRPQITYKHLALLTENQLDSFPDEVLEQIEIQTKYAGYIARQQEEIARFIHYENLALPYDLNYSSITGLSAEVQQKLGRLRPPNLGVASRISGITPAAISLLLIYLKKKTRN